MNKSIDFQALNDEDLIIVFKRYSRLSTWASDNPRSLYHRYMYRSYGEIERRHLTALIEKKGAKAK